MATGANIQPGRDNGVTALTPSLDLRDGSAEMWRSAARLADQIGETETANYKRIAERRGAEEGAAVAAGAMEAPRRRPCRGGGLGILGDFFYAAQARNGKTASQVAAFGPVGGAIGDAYAATGGNVVQVAEGLRTGDDLGEAVKGANVGRDVANLARRYVPGANLWFLRAAWNRAVVDNLQRIVDPEAEEAFARQRKRLEREQGQTQWWETGETVPG